MMFAQYDWSGLIWLWWAVGALAVGMIVWVVIAAVAGSLRTRLPQGPAATDEELLRREYSSGAISREEYERRLRRQRS